MTRRISRPVLPVAARGEVMTEDEARAFLASECEKAGGQRAWALAHCISPSYVNDAITGRRTIGAGLAEALGLVRTLTFTRPVCGDAVRSGGAGNTGGRGG